MRCGLKPTAVRTKSLKGLNIITATWATSAYNEQGCRGSITLAEKIIKYFEQLPEEKKKQVIDFVEFIKTKEQKELESLMDNIISENMEALRSWQSE